MARRTRERSTRSRVVELVLAIAAVGLIYLFVANGGTSWAGDFLAPLFRP